MGLPRFKGTCSVAGKRAHPIRSLCLELILSEYKRYRPVVQVF